MGERLSNGRDPDKAPSQEQSRYERSPQRQPITPDRAKFLGRQAVRGPDRTEYLGRTATQGQARVNPVQGSQPREPMRSDQQRPADPIRNDRQRQRSGR